MNEYVQYYVHLCFCQVKSNKIIIKHLTDYTFDYVLSLVNTE